MSSTPTAADESAHLLDLQTVFRHPAGLRTARFLVSSFLRALPETNTPAEHLFSSVSLPFLDTDTTSSEVANILRDVLAFSDAGEETEGQAGSSLTTNQSVGTGNLSTSSRGDLSVSQMNTYGFSVDSRNENDAINVYTSFPSHNIQSTYSTSKPAIEPSQHQQGTDSPYRVESPFRGQSTDLNFQSSCHPPSTMQSHGQSSNPYNINHLPSPNLTMPNHPISNTAGDVAMKDVAEPPPRIAARPLQPNKHTTSTSNAGRPLPKETPTIKNFLPVNKGGESHNVNVRKDAPLVNSTINRRLMPNSLPSAMNPISKTSSPTNSSAFFQASRNDNNIENSEAAAMGLTSNVVAKKRKSKRDPAGAPPRKKKAAEKGDKVRRMPKVKEPKPEPARYKLGPDLWMRILEFTPPSFIRKARTLNKEFKELVDKYQSIYLNQRIENYGPDMPEPSKNMSERQFNDLLSGKGCMEPGCSDEKASRTHWSWELRWCQNCWKSKIEREDRLQKLWQTQMTRTGINRLLECLPVGMHDSFMKPHDYIEDLEARPRSAPRLYRYYLKADVERIVEEYEALKAPPFKENPEHTAAEKATALAAHQALETEFVAKRAEFLDTRKAENDARMKRVVLIETAIRKRREKVAQPYDANRNGRKERFTKGALEDLPHIPIEFVKRTKAYKAATRIFRNAGSNRGWQVLKPKIEAEWEQSAESKALNGTSNSDVDERSTTRESSTVHESAETPEPLPEAELEPPIRHHVAPSTPSALQVAHQHAMNAEAARQNGLMQSMRMNAMGQFQSANYYPGGSQPIPQGAFQAQRVPTAFMLPTAISYPHGAMSRNDFSMAGSPLSSIHFAPYAAYSNGNNFAHFQGNSSSQQLSTTQIPIDSLLNGPSSLAPHFQPWP